MINNFQGDPRLVLGVNGSKLVFRGGQPVMDQGIENIILILLFTGPGWVGNDLVLEEEKKIGSRFEEIAAKTITLENLVELENETTRILSIPLFGDVETIVTNPFQDQKLVETTVFPPGQDSQTLSLLKNGLNWINQKNNPANLRI